MGIAGIESTSKKEKFFQKGKKKRGNEWSSLLGGGPLPLISERGGKADARAGKAFKLHPQNVLERGAGLQGGKGQVQKVARGAFKKRGLVPLTNGGKKRGAKTFAITSSPAKTRTRETHSKEVPQGETKTMDPSACKDESPNRDTGVARRAVTPESLRNDRKKYRRAKSEKGNAPVAG